MPFVASHAQEAAVLPHAKPGANPEVWAAGCLWPRNWKTDKDSGDESDESSVSAGLKA